MRVSHRTIFLGTFLASAIVHAADSNYHNGGLTVPRVDTPEQVGRYQNVRLELGAGGNWRLSSVDELGAGRVARVPPETIEVVRTESFPASVYLRVSGSWWACQYNNPSSSMRVQPRQTGNRFEVLIAAVLAEDNPGGQLCASVMKSFRITVPLPVYGLAAGQYDYDVNGMTGSFTLDRDNRYTDDCNAISEYCQLPDGTRYY